MTLTYSEIMIRYGELSTKGKTVCVSSINFAIIFRRFVHLSPVKVTADRDRAHAYTHGRIIQPVAESLKQVFANPKLFTRLQD